MLLLPLIARFCGLQRVKDDLRQIYVQHNERYRASKGRAESRVERQHGPSLQIRYYKQFTYSACSAPCKLGEVIIILMEKLRKQYFFTCNLVGRSGSHFQKESREHQAILLRSELRWGHRWISWLRAAAEADMGSQSGSPS